jgi:hypothetical protein
MSDNEYGYGGRPGTVERPQDERDDQGGVEGGEGEQAGPDGYPEPAVTSTYRSATVEGADDDPYATQAADVEAPTDPTNDPYAEQLPAADAELTGYLPPVRESSVVEPAAGNDTAVPFTPTDHYARMQEIQVAFIDDPRKAALDAEDLLSDVLKSFADELARQRDTLQSSPADGVPDTERMRLAVRRSRELIDVLSNLN